MKSRLLGALTLLSILAGGAQFAFADTNTLTVNLVATPNSGTAPLNGVDLTASVGGTATGTINYTFYCDRSDSNTAITNPFGAQFLNASDTMQVATDTCAYANPGTYSGKVIVERGGLTAEARATVTVTAVPSTLGVTLTPSQSSGTAPLNGVSLTANVTGTATGTINYTFYCDRSDANTTVTTPFAAQVLASGDTSKVATAVCSYANPGTYYTKVIVERGGLSSETRAAVTVTTVPTTFAVSLTPSPSSGTAPLNAVNLTATVSGTATGTTDYTFYCDRSDTNTTITTPFAAQVLASADTMKLATGACSYTNPGTYSTKVIAVRGGYSAEARANVVVATPSTGTTTVESHDKRPRQFQLEVGPNGQVLMRGVVDSVNGSTLMVKSWGGIWKVNTGSAQILQFHTGTTTAFAAGDLVGVLGKISTTDSFAIDATLVRNWTERTVHMNGWLWNKGKNMFELNKFFKNVGNGNGKNKNERDNENEGHGNNGRH